MKPGSVPPEASPRAVALRERVVAPVARFLHVEAASGILLLISAVVALVWVNAFDAESYRALWHTPVGLRLGPFVAEADLHFVINDGLMVLFFFVVGLEIRREIHEGELSDWRRASLPIAAAVGGMVAPAAIYLALNPENPERAGWGVPMATDIAFAVGIMTLLGKRVPVSLRVLLLALAVFDDIGAILVIAFFYSSGVELSGFGLAALGMLAVFGMQRFGVRSPLVYVAPGLLVWYGVLKAGVHPTIAGVIVGLMTPVKTWLGTQGFLDEARQILDDFRDRADDQRTSRELVEPLEELQQARREAVAPLSRIEFALHPWVAYVIMPIFALANAGVELGSVDLGRPGAPAVALGITLGLFLGKPLGIVGFSFVAAKLGLCKLPTGVRWRGLWVLGLIAGVGFTMAIFVANLAFGSPELLALGKLGVLAGSGLAGLVGLGLGALMLKPSSSGSVAPAKH